MRHEISWEKEKKHSGALVDPQRRGSWYDCLLLFCGACLCVWSAWLQMYGMLDGLDGITPVRHTFRYLLLALILFSFFYGSGLFSRLWMRALPAIPVVFFALRFFRKHQLPLEDGILYLLRMYVAKICKYYECVLIFPLGKRSEAPMALAFWLLLLVTGCFLLAGIVKKMELFAVLPLAMLIASVAVGEVSDRQGIVLLFAGVIVLRMYSQRNRERIRVRAAQLAVALCICIVIGAVCSGYGDTVVAKHDVMMERQLALEDAVLALPVWDLFAQDGTVTNDEPLGKGREVLTMTLSDQPTENVYLKTYAAEHYENGRWSADEAGFAQAATEQKMTAEEAGGQIWNLSREAGTRILDPENGKEAIGNIAMALPKEYDYTITCRNFGKTAPLPYLSSLPEEIRMNGDTAAEKPWTKRSYSGNLMMGGRRTDPLIDYLVTFYLTELWPGQETAISKLKERTNPEDQALWYSELVWNRCAEAVLCGPVQKWLDGYLEQIGWESSGDFRAYLSTLQERGNMSMTNATRLSYVPLLQSFLMYSCTYSKKLDPLPAGADPLDYFLNTSGEGYCVHFASAATLMLQTLGIPARYASGYVVFPKDFKETDEGYSAVVTDERAHAWTEVYLDGFGWLPIEATPGFSDGSVTDEKAPAADEAKDPKGQQKPEEETKETKPAEEKPEEEAPDAGEQKDREDQRDQEAMDLTLSSKVFGRTIRWWSECLIALFVGYFALCLMIDLIRLYQKKKEEQIRQKISEGRCREAILLTNRRMYRMLSARMLFFGRRIRDDEQLRRGLQWFSALREAAVDVETYMVLVRQAYFSDDEMRAEDAEIVYRIYLRCKMKRKERVKKENGTDIFRLDI
ncbi:MAG: transglutaminase domain-containing protein [bacterium]|nr:transglutaminase domain-containing protein [bacterium]MDY4100806.1 transglutaminase domain-containing protein [Lachnospiraceae bacterium]